MSYYDYRLEQAKAPVPLRKMECRCPGCGKEFEMKIRTYQDHVIRRFCTSCKATKRKYL